MAEPFLVGSCNAAHMLHHVQGGNSLFDHYHAPIDFEGGPEMQFECLNTSTDTTQEERFLIACRLRTVRPLT